MHKICYGFIKVLRNDQNWAKILIFWLILGGFFGVVLYPMNFIPRFCQMKYLIKIYIYIYIYIYICGKFHHYSICSCEINFFIDSASMKWPLFRFFWLLFPQKLFDLAEILTRGSPIMQTHCLKNPSKFWKLAQMERTKSLRFWSIFGAQFTVGKSKILIKTKISAKRTSLGISNSDSPSSQKDYRVLIKLIKKGPIFLGFGEYLQ